MPFSRFASGGYEVLVDGVIGPWFLEPWTAQAGEAGLDLRYLVLRPDEAATVSRALARRDHPMRDPDVVRLMWKQFADLGASEPHVVDTTNEDPQVTAAALRGRLETGEFKLG